MNNQGFYLTRITNELKELNETLKEISESLSKIIDYRNNKNE